MKLLSIIYVVITMSLLTACERGDINETTQIDEAVTALQADIDSCNLVVVPTQESTATVEVDVSYWFEEPDISIEIEGDTLLIDLQCYAPCECDGAITAKVPAETAIDTDIGSGNIRIENIEGDVTASSGSGNVTIKNSTGALELDSGSGNINASNISSELIDVHAGSGNITVDCSDKPYDVKADAGSGNVKVSVPKGEYDVAVDSGSGKEKIQNLVNNPSAERTIRAETGSGNVTVKGE